MNLRALFKGSALLLALALLAYGMQVSPLGALVNEHWIDTQVRGQGWSGVLLFVAVGGGLSAVGVPRQLIAFLAGYAFGLPAGVAVGVATALTGCVLGFTLARGLGRGLLRQRLGPRVARFDAFISAYPFSTSLLIRLLPTGSNFITNLVAGASSIRASRFFAGSALGYVPQTLVFALIGSGTQVDPVWRFALAVLLFVASGALAWMLYRRVRQQRDLPADPADLVRDGPVKP